MELESICNGYLAARMSREFREVAEDLTQRIWLGLPATQEDWTWLASALRHDQRKWFVVLFLDVVGPVPEILYEPMIRAAVYETNPSLNRPFVEPCSESFGYRG